MIYNKIRWDDLNAVVSLGTFDGGSDKEYHATIELNKAYASAKEQFLTLEKAVHRLSSKLEKATLVWRHYYVSDAINQREYMSENTDEALTIVQQPPLNGAKAMMWVYFVENTQLFKTPAGTTVMKRRSYTHLFDTRLHERSSVESNSPLMPLPLSVENQTNRIFNRYKDNLALHGCTIKSNCIRTWIFVQNVDVQYAGMVTARREFFEREGLTSKTHFIASTGIEGRYIYPDVLTLIDAYAIAGITPEQIKFLKAPTHLNPTHEYGVTFERGTAVDYGDRRHIFISGTASIDNRGEIVHPLDVEKQTARTFENVKTLLSEADADMTNVACMIVYLRDTADYAIVNRYLNQYYPEIPTVTILAPVCRPGWLVEVECIAIKTIEKQQFDAF